jgi:hypothetical protein
VIEIADVFRRFAEGYLSAHGATILPSHRRAIADILACRTEALGGHLWRCDQCSAAQLLRHGDRDVKVGAGQNLGFPCREPALRLVSMALGTAPVLAGMVGVDLARCCAPTRRTATRCS